MRELSEGERFTTCIFRFLRERSLKLGFVSKRLFRCTGVLRIHFTARAPDRCLIGSAKIGQRSAILSLESLDKLSTIT